MESAAIRTDETRLTGELHRDAGAGTLRFPTIQGLLFLIAFAINVLPDGSHFPLNPSDACIRCAIHHRTPGCIPKRAVAESLRGRTLRTTAAHVLGSSCMSAAWWSRISTRRTYLTQTGDERVGQVGNPVHDCAGISRREHISLGLAAKSRHETSIVSVPLVVIERVILTLTPNLLITIAYRPANNPTDSSTSYR